jgi:hypothetical protein
VSSFLGGGNLHGMMVLGIVTRIFFKEQHATFTILNLASLKFKLAMMGITIITPMRQRYFYFRINESICL